MEKLDEKMLGKLYKTPGTKRAANHLGISPTHFRRWAKSLGELIGAIKPSNVSNPYRWENRCQ